MKIGLIDVDGHNFPNLPLMKISAYHKQQGNEVEFLDYFKTYDIAYKSKVFTFTEDISHYPNAKHISSGGTAYSLNDNLPDEIENIYPDYSLYGINDTAYGFLTRGCPRNCKFCIVGRKEGLCSKKVSDLEQFWKGQKYIKLLDPNLLACKDRLELLQQLIESKAWIDFTQGLDIRFANEEICNLINQLKVKMIHFAWDNMKDSGLIVDKLKEFKKYTKLNYRKLKVYVLTNFNTSINEDLHRIYTLKNLGYDPYLMIFEKWKASKQLLRMQRWVNNKIIFRACDWFEDYKG